MHTPLRIAVVGTNFISDRFLEAIRAVEGVETVAVCSRERQRAETYAKEQGVPHAFWDYGALCASPLVDAVYLAVPNRYHAPYAREAMEAGKHVLVEKPIALSVAELDGLLELSRQRGVALLEAMRPAFDPALAILREHLPLLGKLRYARFEFSQYSSRYDAFRRGEVLRAFDPSYGNAAIMDIGVYALHMAMALLGKPLTVSAHCVKLAGDFEGMGCATLVYPDLLAQVNYAKIHPQAAPSVLVGEEGTLSFDRAPTPAEIILHLRGRDPAKIPFTPPKNNMIYEVEVFRDMIKRGEITHPSMETVRETLAVMDAIRLQGEIVFPQ